MNAQSPKPLQDIRPPAFSDDALALRFVDQFGADYRFVSNWDTWFKWSGTHWIRDDTGLIAETIRDTLRVAADEFLDSSNAKDRDRVARAICSAKTLSAVERMARTDQRIAATPDQWDAREDLLATPGGTVDLRTGVILEAQRTHFATKLTRVAPAAAGTDAPKWRAFLSDVTSGDVELIAYLQRWAGYAASGSTREHAIAFLYGAGRNGKSTFLNCLAHVLGDYAKTTPGDTFTESNFEKHPTELARLAGARLVISTEVEDGKRWAMSKLKSISGGDKISARFMRQDFFEFTPRFKLFVSGNSKPGLRTVDEAIRRRLHLVPFTVTIPEEHQNQKLPGQLKNEAPAILRWLLDGCLAWRDHGLAPPTIVRDATAEYVASEDVFASWLSECTTRSPSYREPLATLFRSWSKYAEAVGEHPGTARKLSTKLEQAGFRKDKGEVGVRFEGLFVNSPPVTNLD